MATLECPICSRIVAYTSLDEVPNRPFCSRRCQLIDLGRWLNEEYRITEELPMDARRDEESDLPSHRDPGAS